MRMSFDMQASSRRFATDGTGGSPVVRAAGLVIERPRVGAARVDTLRLHDRCGIARAGAGRVTAAEGVPHLVVAHVAAIAREVGAVVRAPRAQRSAFSTARPPWWQE